MKKGKISQWLRRRRTLGARGERLAARWLRRRGYRILHRNLRVGRAEADLIALDPGAGTVVIVEVKTRRGGGGPPPESRVDARKRRNLLRLAARLRRGPYDGAKGIRFDVIAIDWPDRGAPSVRHYVSAFDTPW